MLLSRGKTKNIMENEDKNQEIASKTPVNEVPAATRNIKIEALLIAAAIAIGVIVAVIVSLLMPANSGETFEIKYGASEPLIREKGTLIISLINGFAVSWVAFIVIYVLSKICYSASLTFYDSMLNDDAFTFSKITPETPPSTSGASAAGCASA